MMRTRNVRAMDPEMFGPVIAGALALLSLLGARRQHDRQPEDGRTAGQQLAEVGTQVASGSSTAIQRVGTFTTNTTVTAGENVVAATAAVTATAGRLAGRGVSAVIGTAAGVAGQTLANGGGLVVDGVGALTKGFLSPLQRRRPRTSAATPAPTSSRTGPPPVMPGGPSSEGPTPGESPARRDERPAIVNQAPVKKAPLKKVGTRTVPAKQLSVKKARAKKAPATRAATKKAPAKKASAKRTAAKRTSATKRTAKKAPAKSAASKKR